MDDITSCALASGSAGNVSLKILGGVLGHGNSATTERYAHLSTSLLHEAAEMIAGEIASATTIAQAQSIDDEGTQLPSPKRSRRIWVAKFILSWKMPKNSKQSGPRPPRYKGKSRLPLSPAEISHRKAKGRLLRARGGSAEDPQPFNDRSEVLALCRSAGIEHLIDDDRMAGLQRSLQLITGDYLSLRQQTLEAPAHDIWRRFCSSVASKSRDLVCRLDGGSKSDARDLDLEAVKSQVLPESLLRLANLARQAWRASDPQGQLHSDESVRNALNSLEAMGVEPKGLLDEVRSVARALRVLECMSILAHGTRSTPRVNQQQTLLYSIGAAFEAATEKNADQGLAFRIFAEGVFRSVGLHFQTQDALCWAIANALRSAKSDDGVEVWSTEDGLRATTREPTLSTEKSAPRRVRKPQ